MNKMTIDVVIYCDEITIYDEYKNIKKYTKRIIKEQAVIKLPLGMYNKFKKAQKDYYDIEDKIKIWVDAHPEAVRIENYDEAW